MIAVMADLEKSTLENARVVTTPAQFELDPKIERRILRKLDFQLIPPLWFLYVISFVDRGNIGNAKIAGMEKELKLVGNMYNIAVFVFGIGYTLGSIPLNIVFKKTGPKSLAVMMFAWGNGSQ